MPAADSRPTVRVDRSTLSHDAVTCGGSPEVNSTAFNAQPPDLPPVCLVDVGFAVVCQLAPHRRPHHPVLVHRLAPLIHASFRPRLATTPLRFSSPSPPPGWAGDFHPQAVEHVRHTMKKPPACAGGFSGEGVGPYWVRRPKSTYFGGAGWSWLAGAGTALVEASVSRSFFRRLISTRPPLVRLVLASSPAAVGTGALPMPTT